MRVGLVLGFGVGFVGPDTRVRIFCSKRAMDAFLNLDASETVDEDEEGERSRWCVQVEPRGFCEGWG